MSNSELIVQNLQRLRLYLRFFEKMIDHLNQVDAMCLLSKVFLQGVRIPIEEIYISPNLHFVLKKVSIQLGVLIFGDESQSRLSKSQNELHSCKERTMKFVKAVLRKKNALSQYWIEFLQIKDLIP